MITRPVVLCATLITLLWLASVAIAQPPELMWESTYGNTANDQFRHAEPAAGGGFILAGTRSFQFWIVKVDSMGAVQWQRSYGTGGSDIALYACEVANGSIVAIGVGCLDNAHCGTWWTRTSAGGDSLERTFLGSGVAETARRTSDHGFIIPGSDHTGGEFGWLMKTDSSGVVQWAVTYTNINEEANCVAEVMGGGYILGGKTQPGTGFLRRVSATGQSLWRRNYTSSSFTHILGIVQAPDSGFVFDGFNYSNLTYELYLQKVTSQGDSVWSNSFGITTFEALADLCLTRDHGFVLAGYHADSARGVAVRTDSDGNLLWMQTYRPNGPTAFHAVLQTGDGGYLFAGKADADAYLLRLAADAPPAAPTGLTLYRDVDNLILRWTPADSPFYHIYSSASPDGPFDTLEGTTPSAVFSVPIGNGEAPKFFVVVSSTGQ